MHERPHHTCLPINCAMKLKVGFKTAKTIDECNSEVNNVLWYNNYLGNICFVGLVMSLIHMQNMSVRSSGSLFP